MEGQEIYNYLKELFNFPRSITGEGTRETLKKIQKDHLAKLAIHEVPSGTKIEDWIIPNEWNIKEAYIKDSEGRDIINFKNSNLHLVGYSTPIDKKMTLDELNKHLYSLPDQPDAIPYVTSYYKETWGFCISENERKKLKKDTYHVYINSTLDKGSLTYGDLVIEGSEKKEIFISTYICHPSMANNELSGPGLAIYLAKWLSKRSNRYTYRFSFAPETIGSLTYISKNFDKLREVIAAFNLTCVGDSNFYSFMPSRKGDTITDRLARHCIQHQKQEYKEYSFLKDRGSDERQYCSPTVDLPMVSIMKSKYGEYPEYHTSLDDMSFISPEGLEDSLRVHKECIEILENNFHYVSEIKGEPFLSKRGNNYMIIGGIQNKESLSSQLILDIMACCDGSMDVIDIAESLDIYAFKILSIFKTLKEEGLIKQI